MSDTGRKDITTQVQEKLTPDQEKTTGEKVKETVTGVLDKAQAAVTPDTKKSLPQQVSDKAQGSS
jgi:heat shock protein 9/12